MSGSFIAAGSGRYRATKVGKEAYAVQLAQDARRFTLTKSELRSGIDTILKYVTFAIIPTAALLFFSQIRASDGDWREAVSGAVAGTVAMVPEGLVLLTSLAFAVAVVRLAQQRVLVQELPAVEGLARVDVLCIDKTGTLTQGKLSVEAVEPAGSDDAAPAETALAALAAADPSPNATTLAIAERFDSPPGVAGAARRCRSRALANGAAPISAPMEHGSSVRPTWCSPRSGDTTTCRRGSRSCRTRASAWCCSHEVQP